MSKNKDKDKSKVKAPTNITTSTEVEIIKGGHGYGHGLGYSSSSNVTSNISTNTNTNTKENEENTNSTLTIGFKGVGWRVELNNSDANSDKNDLHLFVGLSHPVHLAIPIEIKASISVRATEAGETQLILSTVTAIDIKQNKKSKVLLGDFAAKIRQIRPWNPYTGQGIVRRDRLSGLIRKQGKRS